MKATTSIGIVIFSLIFASIPTSENSCIADVISFLIDPDTIDSDSDGFISGTELSPIGSGGTEFVFEPINNLVGAPRFFLHETRGLQFGGGGGSSLEFTFRTNEDIELESYTLASSGFFLGNPVFDIREGATVLSESNTAIASGNTHTFVDGPISIQAGTDYTFITTAPGAGVQSFMASWDYSVTAVPEPGTTTILLAMGTLVAIRRRK